MIKILGLLTILVLCRTEEFSHVDEEEVQGAEHYAFLLKLIDEYDETGQGAIPKSRYGQFLYQVITQGSKQENATITDTQTLKQAMDRFAATKQTQQIGVQSFYEDLTSTIFSFLRNQKEYSNLLKELYNVTDEQLTEPNLQDYEEVYSSEKGDVRQTIQL